MKMYKVIPMLILLFTGYLCNSMDAAPVSTSLSPQDSFFTSRVTETTELEAKSHWTTHVPEVETPSDRNNVPEKLGTPALLVTGISISMVFIFILIIIGVWCAWKKSKAETNSVPSGESGVYLQRVSMHENQREWPLEGALQ